MSDRADYKLIRLISGALPTEQAEAVEEQIAHDPALARRHHQLLDTWQRLDDWQVEPPMDDLSARVLARLDRAEGHGVTHPRWGGLLRLVAVVGLTGGAGYAAGRALAPGPAPAHAADTELTVRGARTASPLLESPTP